MQRLTIAILITLLSAVQSVAGIETVSNTTYASRTNTTIVAPSGISNGDLLLLFCLTGGSGTSPAVTIPGGFTPLSGSPSSVTDTGSFNIRMWAAYKVATGESGDYTCSHAAASSQGFMLRVSGVNTSSPLDVTPTLNTGTNGTTTFTGVTTTQDNVVVVLAGHDWADTANNLTPPIGTTPTFAEHLDTTLIYAASGTLSSAGATGDKTMTNNSAISSPWAAWMIALSPASVGSAQRTLSLLGVGP